ncbi:DNA-binding transcription factor [Lithospermum erythrorhizon]|uniref:DNA-binding transcription factor n=1 Tax=Lithospermum erythrorhizon TaxID=34254 RepID=A0AAV3QEZ5_LITER
MMASSSELSLDCKQKSYSMLLKSFGRQNNNTYDHHQSQKLEEFLACLEEERLKIDAFKRELPLCMQLLTNAVETYRQQIQSFRTTTTIVTNNQSAKPILEEFIPLKNGNFEGSSEKVTNNVNMSDNKENWMTSAQLWVQTGATDHENATKQQQSLTTKPSSPKEETKLRSNNNGGGAFVPFHKERRQIPELALASSNDNNEMEQKNIIASVQHAEQGKGQPQTIISSNNIITPTNATQSQRKARRCWSPDLHRRFVNALQMLGGSQVATPKQIRELMKVDGLTNDEVKSHLQV